MRRARIVDIAIPLAVFAATAALTAAPESGQEGHNLEPLSVVLAALTALPLLARRRAPLLAFVLSAIASTVLFAVDEPPGPPIGPTVALYFVAQARPESSARRWLTVGIVVGLFLVHVTTYGLAHDKFPGAEALLGTVLWAGVWVLADRTRLRRERMHALEERARRAELEAERERRLAAAEERTRIARDLHDSAGHAINVILVQAGAARLLADKDPPRSREAVATIETVARETLREIDQLVRALREDGTAVEPPAGLAALDTLVERHRAAGLDVEVTVDGRRRPLGPAVDQAAFRILQESLTNALRHGTGAAKVVLGYQDEALEIGVTNPVDGGPVADGHGIVGMRERASLLGGSVEAHSENGLFRIRARLPYGGEESE
jgi:signal transduction histidine kinase